MEITASSTYDLKTCKAIQKFTMFGKNNPTKRLIFWGIIYIILLTAISSLLVQDSSDVFTWILFAVILAVIVFFGIAYFHTPRARYKALGKLADTQTFFRFRKTEFNAFSSADEAKNSAPIKYDSIYRVAETSKYFFIYQKNGKLHIVDKSTVQNGTAEHIKTFLLSNSSVKYIKCRY